MGANRFWNMLNNRPYTPALGALTGNQAVQMVEAGLDAIYVSGWQIAADANLSGNTYPDLGLYPSNSGPQIVRRINRALQRADQIHHAEGKDGKDWFVPIIADGEAGFGGHLNAFELMKEMIEAGAAGVHFEDQLTSERKCGHLGGKVLVPTNHFIRTLVAARPGKPLAYNCSSSFNWEERLGPLEIDTFQQKLASFGYKFQFVTLAGFHSLNHSMFELARAYVQQGMSAYVRLQRREFQTENEGYRAVKHQSFVGTGYFDQIAQVISGGDTATVAMKGSTEAAQFGRKVEVSVPTDQKRRPLKE